MEAPWSPPSPAYQSYPRQPEPCPRHSVQRTPQGSFFVRIARCVPLRRRPRRSSARQNIARYVILWHRMAGSEHRRDSMRQGTVDIGVGGMSCASCVASLKAALGRVPGVAHVSVNLATERATMTYDTDMTSVPALA